MRTLKRKTIKQKKREVENWNHDNEGLPYTKKEDNNIWKSWIEGNVISLIAVHFKRSLDGIFSKINHILEDYGKDKNGKLRMGGKKHPHVKLRKKRSGKWWDHCDVIDETLHRIMLNERRVFYHIFGRDGKRGAYRIAELTGRSYKAVITQMEKVQGTGLTLFDKQKVKCTICPKCGHKY